METICMSGGFGVMDLTLALSDYGVLTLWIDFNHGEAKGAGDLYLKQAGIIVRDYQIPDILKTVEMWNTLPNGSGRLWRFTMVGGINTLTEEESPAQFIFNIALVSQRSKRMYSRLSFTPEEVYSTRISYQGAMRHSVIEWKLNRKALADCVESAKDMPQTTARIDMVTYLRERNPMSALQYCPDLGIE